MRTRKTHPLKSTPELANSSSSLSIELKMPAQEFEKKRVIKSFLFTMYEHTTKNKFTFYSSSKLKGFSVN